MTPYAAPALVSYGIIIQTMNGHDTALRLACLARKLIEATNGTAMIGRTQISSCPCIYSWSRPQEKQFKDLELGYRSSMQVGDVETAFFNWYIHVDLGFMMGNDLSRLVQSHRAIMREAKEYHVLSIQRMIGVQLPVMEGMAGEKPINWVDVRNFGARSGSREAPNDTYFLTAGYAARLRVAVYFQQYDVAGELADRFEKLEVDKATYNVIVPQLLFVGLAAAGCYRSTNKKKHLKRLQQKVQEFKSLVRHRGLNCLHHSLLLTAQLKAVTASPQRKIKDAYDIAIAIAHKAGCMQDVALASELAGETFRRMGVKEVATTYFMEATIQYSQWGCKAKVDDIKKRHTKYLDLRHLAKVEANNTNVGKMTIPMIGFNPRDVSSNDTIGGESGVLTSTSPTMPSFGSVNQAGDMLFPYQQGTCTDQDDDISMLSDD
uniref:Uncharacterized protein n=1 Tax=Craspedostauros australis TaxID=1486917 RepID=A0A7R9ZN04_9STRA